MDTQRLILLFIFSFSLLMLWEAWDKQGRPKPPPSPATQQRGVPAPASPATPGAAKPAAPAAAAGVPASEETAKGEAVVVRTDLMVAEVDTLGGTLKRVE